MGKGSVQCKTIGVWVAAEVSKDDEGEEGLSWGITTPTSGAEKGNGWDISGGTAREEWRGEGGEEEGTGEDEMPLRDGTEGDPW